MGGPGPPSQPARLVRRPRPAEPPPAFPSRRFSLCPGWQRRCFPSPRFSLCPGWHRCSFPSPRAALCPGWHRRSRSHRDGPQRVPAGRRRCSRPPLSEQPRRPAVPSRHHERPGAAAGTGGGRRPGAPTAAGAAAAGAHLQPTDPHHRGEGGQEGRKGAVSPREFEERTA